MEHHTTANRNPVTLTESEGVHPIFDELAKTLGAEVTALEEKYLERGDELITIVQGVSECYLAFVSLYVQDRLYPDTEAVGERLYTKLCGCLYRQIMIKLFQHALLNQPWLRWLTGGADRN